MAFGWRPYNENTVADGVQSLDDYVRNGKYCKSGLAYQGKINEAVCADASET